MKPKSPSIHQQPLIEPRKCPWHRSYPQGKTFTPNEIFPNDCCPWLYHTLYPYFLALQYGARFTYNEEGDCHVGCPALHGIDLIVRKRPYRDDFDPRITDTRPVIYAEVIVVHRSCPYGHQVGQQIIYPVCMNRYYLCPAGFDNVFPLLKLQPPECIDPNNIRCPDWADFVTYSLSF